MKNVFNKRLFEKEISKILTLFEKGETNSSIARKYAVSRERIRQIIWERKKTSRSILINQKYYKLLPQIITLFKKGYGFQQIANIVNSKKGLNLTYNQITYLLRKHGFLSSK